MRTLSIICVVGSLALYGCGPDCSAPNSGQGQTTGSSDGTNASATANDIDTADFVKVDVSDINSDYDFESAVNSAWSDYQTEMNSVPSAYTSAAPKLQPLLEALRVRNMKAYTEWADAKMSNNFEKQIELEDTVPALKEYKAGEDQIMKGEEVVEAQAKQAKRVVALRKYAMTVVALYKAYIAKETKTPGMCKLDTDCPGSSTCDNGACKEE